MTKQDQFTPLKSISLSSCCSTRLIARFILRIQSNPMFSSLHTAIVPYKFYFVLAARAIKREMRAFCFFILAEYKGAVQPGAERIFIDRSYSWHL